MIEVVFYRSRSLRRNQRFRFRVVYKSNGKPLAVASEGYANQSECEHAAWVLTGLDTRDSGEVDIRYDEGWYR